MDTLLAAARFGDPIAHTASKGWMIAGMIAGAVIGAVAVVATGGAALTVIAAVAAGAAAGGGLGEVLGTMSWAPRHVTGSLTKGSPNVFINSRPAIRAILSLGLCSDHAGPPQVVAQGSSTVFINSQPASRKEDRMMCGALINDGSPNVFIGGPAVGEFNPEIPAWVNWTMLAVGVAATAVLAGPAIAILGAAGGFVGGEVGSWIGGKVFGEGSDGQKWSMLGGSLLGGAGAAKGAGLVGGAKGAGSVAGEISVGETAADALAGTLPKAGATSPFDYVVDTMPADLVSNPKGVYGYTPVEGSEFAAPKWPVDWTNPEQVANARNVRLEYHQGLADERAWIADMRASGASQESIGRQIVDMRNQTRMSKYAEDKLPVLYERNMAKYGNKYGPTYEALLQKYGSPEGVIAAGTRSNPTMDILTGIAKVGK
ncbi:UNVERIFIED_ORG: putative Zn-binding protein involved in type VI secretion [Burkholderia territorii]